MKANPVWEVRAHNNHKKDNGGEKRTKMNEIELALLSTSAQFIVRKSCDELRIVSSKNVEFMQGQLQIWTDHSTLIFENLKPVEKSKNNFNIILTS